MFMLISCTVSELFHQKLKVDRNIIVYFIFSVQAKAIENSRKCSASVAAGNRGAAAGSKPTDDDIQGPEYYAGRIAAIEAADVSMIWSVAIVFS